LAAARCGGGAQRDGGSAVAAARWLRRWRQRGIVTLAAAWRRRATGDDNEDDDNGDGDGAMDSGATGYDDDDDDDDGDGQRQRRQRSSNHRVLAHLLAHCPADIKGENKTIN
jgi:hypothetical protein